MILAQLDELSVKHKAQFDLIKIDVDISKRLAKKHVDVKALPTFVLLKNDRTLNRFSRCTCQQNRTGHQKIRLINFCDNFMVFKRKINEYMNQ